MKTLKIEMDQHGRQFFTRAHTVTRFSDHKWSVNPTLFDEDGERKGPRGETIAICEDLSDAIRIAVLLDSDELGPED